MLVQLHLETWPVLLRTLVGRTPKVHVLGKQHGEMPALPGVKDHIGLSSRFTAGSLYELLVPLTLPLEPVLPRHLACCSVSTSYFRFDNVYDM